MDHEPASFDIPGLIFQAKVTKFGTKTGLKMLININSGFFHNQQKKMAIFLRILQLCTRLLSSYDSDLGPFCSRLQLCTRPPSYDSDLGPFCSRQLWGLPSSAGYFYNKAAPKHGQHCYSVRRSFSGALAWGPFY